MQIKPVDLQRHLERTLAQIYLVSGDEPLQVEEALDQIRKAAKDQGFDERTRLEVTNKFDWSLLRSTADTMSLFAQKRILDLRLPSGKPGEAGSKALIAFAQHPSPENLLIISTRKLDPSSRRTKWYRAIESTGVSIQAWPISAAQLSNWIRDRARRKGIHMTMEAADLLGDRVEGNLLACSQEIDKLSLLYPSTTLDPVHIVESVSDSARFSIFDCVDSALEGNPQRVIRICQGLHQESIEPVLLSWALSREIRLLETIATEAERGAGITQALNGHKLWESRKRSLLSALRRHPAKQFQLMLRQLAMVDKVIKGAAVGNPWDQLTRIGLGLAGVLVLKH